VLSDDVLDPQKVPDAAIKRVHAVMTVVGGKVIYDAAR
jgi:predicted amidohydrolase YtcJ